MVSWTWSRVDNCTGAHGDQKRYQTLTWKMKLGKGFLEVGALEMGSRRRQIRGSHLKGMVGNSTF